MVDYQTKVASSYDVDKDKVNVPMVLGIVFSVLTIFGGAIGYTIYRKTKDGWYDDDNNEITNPIEREKRKLELKAR